MLYVKKANVEDIEKEWAFVRDMPETFLFLWEDDKIVGQFRIRHYLNDALREGGGHIVKEDDEHYYVRIKK